MSRSTRHTHPRITWWGVAVLFAGLLAAEAVYFLAASDDESDVASAMTHTKIYQHNMELVGGKAAILAGGFADWFASLWHGQRLAWVIAIVTVVVAAVCFFVGWLQGPPVDDRKCRSGGRPFD
jgi:hypothetical protein